MFPCPIKVCFKQREKEEIINRKMLPVKGKNKLSVKFGFITEGKFQQGFKVVVLKVKWLRDIEIVCNN